MSIGEERVQFEVSFIPRLPLPVLLLWSSISFCFEVIFPHSLIHYSPLTKRPEIFVKCKTSFFVALPPNMCNLSACDQQSNIRIPFPSFQALTRAWTISWVLRLVTWEGRTWNIYCERGITTDLFNLRCKILRGKHSEHSIQRTPAKFNVFFNKRYLPLAYMPQSWFINVWRSGARPWHTGHSYKLFEGTKEEAAISLYQRYGREESPAWKACNWLNLMKLVNGTRIFHRKVSNGKTGLPFQTFRLFRKFSSGTY